jgi:hypothetical protein
MPYGDPERRRQFQREYKRKWRKAQEKINPLRFFKVYVCMRFPNLYLPGGAFSNGFLITDDPQVQARVEAHDLFARSIFPLALDLSCRPAKAE